MKLLTREGKRQGRFRQHTRLLKLSATVLIFTVAAALKVATGDTQAAAKQGEERETLRVIETVVNAWNRSDADTLAQQFLPDGLVVLPRGNQIQSRPNIRKRVAEERNGRLQETTLQKTVENVSFRDDNTAVVKGRYQLEGMTILNLFEISPKGTFVLEQVRAQGRWMISRAELKSR